jgi:hypothetical protein
MMKVFGGGWQRANKAHHVFDVTVKLASGGHAR